MARLHLPATGFGSGTWPRWTILAAAALLMGLAGPFGTYLGMTLPVRLLHFASTVASISLLVGLMHVAARRWLFRRPVPLWGEVVIAGLAAPPGGLIIAGLLTLWAPRALAYVSWPELVVQTFLVNLAILVAIHGFAAASAARSAPPPPEGAPDGAPEAPPAAVEEPGAALRQRLPLPLRRAPILFLSAEDHYVRVVTERGDALVLMPLSEAADALGPGAGLRIHRSHWIARQALEAPGTTVTRTAVRLAGGGELPVSRTGRRALVEAGLA